jgi:phosphonoacetaldehyde hydrolase
MDFIFQRSYRGALKAVILDWAGTAVDYGSFAPTAVFLRLFENEGVSISAADARSGMGLMKKDHLRTILKRPSVADAWLAAHDAPASDADIERLFELFVPMQLAVVREYALPIPGLQQTVADLRRRGTKIGTTTGYIRSMMAELGPEAAKHGYVPDCIVCPDDVPAGRPFPWMCYQNAAQLGVYPMPAMVKVGDTLVDVEEGLNAGMWSVGLVLTGNLMGLDEAGVAALSPADLAAARERISANLLQAGAHLVIDGIWDLPAALDEIQARVLRGERP